MVVMVGTSVGAKVADTMAEGEPAAGAGVVQVVGRRVAVEGTVGEKVEVATSVEVSEEAVSEVEVVVVQGVAVVVRWD